MIVFKMVFMRPSLRLLFRVGHHVCLGLPGMPKSYLSPTFDQDIDVQSFEIIFLTPNRPNKKTSRKKKFGLIFIFNNFFSENSNYFKESFAELFCDLKWSNCIFT